MWFWLLVVAVVSFVLGYKHGQKVTRNLSRGGGGGLFGGSDRSDTVSPRGNGPNAA